MRSVEEVQRASAANQDVMDDFVERNRIGFRRSHPVIYWALFLACAAVATYWGYSLANFLWDHLVSGLLIR